MKLEFLGTGNAFNPVEGNCSILIDKKVLVDCGSTIPLELIKKDKIKSIEDIIITHLHSDHVGGLELLGQLLFFKYKRRARLWLSDTMREDIWEHTLKGGMEYLNTHIGSPCKASLATYFDTSYCLTPIQTETHHECYYINTDVCSFILERTNHVPDMESYSLLIDNDIIYTSDINNCIFGHDYYLESLVSNGTHFGTFKEISDLVIKSDVRAIFHDAQCIGRSDNQVHAYIKDVIDGIPEKYRAKTWFMHYDSDYKSWEPSVVAQGFKGFVKKGIFEF